MLAANYCKLAASAYCNQSGYRRRLAISLVVAN